MEAPLINISVPRRGRWPRFCFRCLGGDLTTMWLLSVRRMDLEDVESTESFYFLLRPLCSSVLPYVGFFFFNLTCWSFQGFRRSVVKKLISHLRTVGESFNLHIFHGITWLSDTWKTLEVGAGANICWDEQFFFCLVSLKFRRVKSMIIMLVGRHFLSGCFCWGNIMQCERRLYGISGIAFYRVGKAGCLQKSPAREFAVRARWNRAALQL